MINHCITWKKKTHKRKKEKNEWNWFRCWKIFTWQKWIKSKDQCLKRSATISNFLKVKTSKRRSMWRNSKKTLNLTLVWFGVQYNALINTIHSLFHNFKQIKLKARCYNHWSNRMKKEMQFFDKMEIWISTLNQLKSKHTHTMTMTERLKNIEHKHTQNIF